MPGKRPRKAESARSKDQLSREMKRSRLALFVQQFEKEGLRRSECTLFVSFHVTYWIKKDSTDYFTAQESMEEREAKMENLLATVEKVFKVELMKMPSSLRNTLIGDLISKEVSKSEVSIAIMNEPLELNQPLKRVPSKTVKSTTTPTVLSTPVQRSSSKTSKGGKGTKRTRTLVGSNSTGNLGGSSVTAKGAQNRLTKTSDLTVPTKPKLRSVVSTGDLHCSMAGSAAHITVTTALGQTVSFSEETKDEINLDMLDDVAWCQIQKLTSLMGYLSQRSRSQQCLKKHW